jgi:LuxR family maltose regulon positive regulatory protein
LLSQWADRDDRPFAWVSVDDRDNNDAKVLLTYVAEALDRVEPVGARVFDALRSPVSSVPGSVVPRLAAAFASMASPVVLVLDDVHLLHNSECLAAVSTLAEEVPGGSQIVLAGRAPPPVRIARLRAEDRLLEVGPADLSMTVDEAAAVLAEARVALGADDVAVLHERAEGWPVGLYLAALYLREGGSVSQAAVSFSGDDRVVSEYMESEFLEKTPAHQRAFLTRSSALQRMSGPLCEAALDLPDAATTLADLARSNLLFVPLDRRGQWYRYHHLFGDMLRAELARREPAVMPAVRQRAAKWCLENDQPEEALEYSIAANDSDAAAELGERVWLSVFRQSRYDTLERWLHWLDERGAVRRHPVLAAAASFTYTASGRAAEAEKWADLVDHWQYGESGWAGGDVTEAFAAQLRAQLCRNGVEQMRLDAEEAIQKFAAAGITTPSPTYWSAVSHVLAGDPASADDVFDEVATIATRINTDEMLVAARWQQTFLAIARSDWDKAEDLAAQARAAAGTPGFAEAGLWAAEAGVAAHHGDLAAAQKLLTAAQRLRPLVSYAVPAYAVQLRVELARASLKIGDTSGARTVTAEAEEILQRRPELGTLVNEVAELTARLAGEQDVTASGPSALTTAELRLLPRLCTHLTTPEIAAQMFLSRHTIRSQMQSIYRKLNANNRSDAVARARALNLVD